MKMNYKKSLKLITLLISSLLIATVSATAYVTLQWTTTTTVADNPKVCFIKWADSSKQNSFAYSVNIFLNIKTVDENVSYGVWDWDTAAHTCAHRLASENTNSTDVSWVYVKIYNSTATIHSHNYTDFATPDTSWYTFTAAASAKYTIWIEIKAGSSAGAGHTPQFTFEMKVENP